MYEVSFLRFTYIKLFVEAVVENQIVRHANTVRFHWMTLPVIIISYFWIVEVCHLFHNHSACIDVANIIR